MTWSTIQRLESGQIHDITEKRADHMPADCKLPPVFESGFAKTNDDFIPDGDDTKLTWSPLGRLEIGQNYRYQSRPRAYRVQLFPFV